MLLHLRVWTKSIYNVQTGFRSCFRSLKEGKLLEEEKYGIRAPNKQWAGISFEVRLPVCRPSLHYSAKHSRCTADESLSLCLAHSTMFACSPIVAISASPGTHDVRWPMVDTLAGLPVFPAATRAEGAVCIACLPTHTLLQLSFTDILSKTCFT